MSNNAPITPEVGKRYVTRGGWVTPPMTMNDDDDDAKYYPFKAMDTFYTARGLYFDNNMESDFDLVAEYVEPTAPPDTFRRDLVARLYVAMIGGDPTIIVSKDTHKRHIAKEAVWLAEILIEELEDTP